MDSRYDAEQQSFLGGPNAAATTAGAMRPLNPLKQRKTKAATLTAAVWEPYKEEIIRLHIQEKLPLAKVRELMTKDHGFTAE
jgi:hypothetical protein